MARGPRLTVNPSRRQRPGGFFPYFAAHEGGFTLAELIVVILLVGILAAVTIPRFAGIDEFRQAAFEEEFRATLRAAQKAAVAQRQRVQVTVTAVGLAANLCAVASGADSCGAPTVGCSGALAGPTGQPLGAIAPDGIVIAPALAFRFDCLGRPMQDDAAPLATTVFALGGGPTVTVEAETGYVH